MTHEWLGCHFAPAQHYANSKGLAGFIPLICRKMMAWPSEKGSHLEKFRPNHWNWVISKWFSGSICSILKAFFSEPRGLQGTLTFLPGVSLVKFGLRITKPSLSAACSNMAKVGEGMITSVTNPGKQRWKKQRTSTGTRDGFFHVSYSKNMCTLYIYHIYITCYIYIHITHPFNGCI